MSRLNYIAERHERDRWKDLAFVSAAALLLARAIGATTSRGVGRPAEHSWSITVVDPDTQLQLR